MNNTLSYGNLPQGYCDIETASIVIVPVAYDKTSTWIKGAGNGPAAIIEASAHMELYDIETDSEVYKQGIYTQTIIEGDMSPKEMVQTVYDSVADYLDNDKYTVVLGGEHSVSIGSIKAHADKCHNLTVLQLDAHADLRDTYNGSKYNHACVMARVQEMCPITQVGIRSMDYGEKALINPARCFYARDIQNNSHWIRDVLSQLSENVYVTIDLDVFDPSVMPSTGTPEPGGLYWYDVTALLQCVCKEKNVVGFDVVELCPDGRNKAPDFLAAKLIYVLLSYQYGVHQ